MTSDVTYLWVCDKTIFRIRIPTQRKLTNEKHSNSQQNLVVILAGTDLENKIIYILHKKDKKNIRTKLSSLGQEPTFKACFMLFFSGEEMERCVRKLVSKQIER